MGTLDHHGDRPVVDPAKRAAWTGLGLAAMAAVLLTAGVTSDWPWLRSVDAFLTSFTRDWADPLGWPVDVAHAIGLATSPLWSTLLVIVAVLSLSVAQQRAAAGYLALSGGTGVVAVELTKTSVGRTRPPGAAEFQSDLLRSFPSGHSAASIYVYLALGLVLVQLGRGRGNAALRGAGWTLVVLAPFIGVSRLVLGVHWPSDVLAGWAFGSTATLAAALLLWAPLESGWDRRGALAPGANLPAQVTSEPPERAEGP
ncbi:MAG: phosphatase PAP2 family protein [Candidatus Nanopelagicales bacterium]